MKDDLTPEQRRRLERCTRGLVRLMFENDCFLEFGETESGEAAVFFALNEDDPDVGIHFSTAAH